MNFQKTVLLLAALLFYGMSLAQSACTSVIKGTVLDEAGQPLISASVLLVSQNKAIVTDTDGHFVIDQVCAGNQSITIRYTGYKTVEQVVEVTGTTAIKVSLQPDVQNLKEVVIQSKAENIDHAQNYTELTEKQLERTAGKSLGEALKEIPGVNTIQSGPGIFKPVIHGVHSQRILILNYGIRQEGQQWGAEHAPEVDPFIASNIVVIKDASAIKYGTDALGGVIVINPPELPVKAILGGTFNTVLQSNGRSGTVSGMLEGGIKNYDGWGWRVQGTVKRSGDFSSPHYMLTNTGVQEINFSGATGYHHNNNGVELFFSHFQTKLGILKGTSIGNLNDLATAMEREPPQYTAPFSYSISEPHQAVSHNLVKFSAHTQRGHNDYRVVYGFQNNTRQEFDFRVGVPTLTPSIDLQLNTHTLQTEWENTKHDKRSFCFGFSGMLQNNKNVYGTQRIPFIPNFNNVSGGVFGISKLLLNHWTVDIGLRYDVRHYDVAGYDYKNTLYKSSLLFHNASATLGAVLQLKGNQSLSMNLSSAWRPPSVSELYSSGTHQSAASIEYGLLLNDSTTEVMNIKDVPFKVEQAVKWVTTYQQAWTKFQFEASGYVNYIANYIYLRPTGITKNIRGALPYFRYTQTDALFVGLDLSGLWHVASHWSVIPKASILSASDVRHHDYLVFIPANRYEMALRYEKPALLVFRSLFVEIKGKYSEQQYRAPKRVITPQQFIDAGTQKENPFKDDTSNFDFMKAPAGYFLMNVAVGVSVKTKRARYNFRLAAENMLNKAYRDYTNRFRYYADDVGRNISFSMKRIF